MSRQCLAYNSLAPLWKDWAAVDREYVLLYSYCTPSLVWILDFRLTSSCCRPPVASIPPAETRPTPFAPVEESLHPTRLLSGTFRDRVSRNQTLTGIPDFRAQEAYPASIIAVQEDMQEGCSVSHSLKWQSYTPRARATPLGLTQRARSATVVSQKRECPGSVAQSLDPSACLEPRPGLPRYTGHLTRRH